LERGGELRAHHRQPETSTTAPDEKKKEPAMNEEMAFVNFALTVEAHH
jgi:hypothetical protein